MNEKHLDENLFLFRFWDLDDLKATLKDLIDIQGGELIECVESWRNEDIDDFDYLIVCDIIKDDDDYFLDIYYTKSKNHCIITEIILGKE